MPPCQRHQPQEVINDGVSRLIGQARPVGQQPQSHAPWTVTWQRAQRHRPAALEVELPLRRDQHRDAGLLEQGHDDLRYGVKDLLGVVEHEHGRRGFKGCLQLAFPGIHRRSDRLAHLLFC